MKNKVSICKKDICFHANGDNANTITKAVSTFLLFAGVAAIISAALGKKLVFS